MRRKDNLTSKMEPGVGGSKTFREWFIKYVSFMYNKILYSLFPKCNTYIVCKCRCEDNIFRPNQNTKTGYNHQHFYAMYIR